MHLLHQYNCSLLIIVFRIMSRLHPGLLLAVSLVATLIFCITLYYAILEHRTHLQSICFSHETNISNHCNISCVGKNETYSTIASCDRLYILKTGTNTIVQTGGTRDASLYLVIALCYIVIACLNVVIMSIIICVRAANDRVRLDIAATAQVKPDIAATAQVKLDILEIEV